MATVDVGVQQMLIGGRWVGASSERTFDTANPFTGEPVGSAAAASRAAVDAARDALREHRRAQGLRGVSAQPRSAR